MKILLKYKKNKLKNNIIKKYRIFLFIIYIFFVSFFSEAISRLSIKNTFNYIINSSFYFTINTLIISMVFLIFIIIFNNKYISSSLLTIIILFISIGTNIKLEYRGTGLTPVDFLIISEAGEMAMGMKQNYIIKIILYSLVFIILSYILIITMYLPKIKNKTRIKNSLIIIIIFHFLFILTPKWSLIKNKSDFFNWELEKNGNAKDLGGFFYFISKCNNPIDLKTSSKILIEKTFPYLFKNNYLELINTKNSPDIIFIQSESFYDIKNLGLENFTEDPLPFYHKLINESDSFYLTSPTRGGGTANAEFEIMTGIPTLFFPTDLSIYSGYLNQPTISVGSILRNQGYNSQLIHPFLGVFYRRNIIYNLFGFNDFISIDTMKYKNKDFNEKAFGYKGAYYVNDIYLMNQIIKQLENKKDKKNFIFAITMQCHIPFKGNSKYNHIKYIGNFLQDSDFNKDFHEYIKILKDVDESLKIIINYLKNTKKPTLLFFYGDHQPFFEFPNKNLKEKPYEQFKVPAFIWSNYKNLNETNYLLDMTSAAEKVLSYSDVKIPNYYKILNHFRLKEKIETITEDYVIIDGHLYNLATKEYKQIRKKYQIMASDILSNNKFIEKNQNNWIIQNNKEYIPPVPFDK